MIHRNIICGLACATLLLLIGCTGGDPEIQPQKTDPTPPPTAGSSDNQTPEEPAETGSTTPGAETPSLESSDSDGTAGKTTPTDTADPSALDPSKLLDTASKKDKAILEGIPRTRPEDPSQWELTDFVPAENEKDPHLKMALGIHAKKNKGRPVFAQLLKKLLQPNVPTDPNSQGNTHGGRGQAQKLDQQTVEMIIAALAYNNTTEAAKTLREIIENKEFNIVQPQEATKAAIESLAVMETDRKANDIVLFTALTNPTKYRKRKSITATGGMHSRQANRSTEERMSAEQLSQEAEKILKPIASENLRLLLADYLIKNTTPLVHTDRFGPWFTESMPANVSGQLTIYVKKANEPTPPTLEGFISTLERNFNIYSRMAIARLLDVETRTPDLLLLAQAGQAGGIVTPPQPPVGWGAGSGNSSHSALSGGYQDTDLIKEIQCQKPKPSAEEELARLMRKIWAPKIATAVTQRLKKQSTNDIGKSSADEDQSVALACTMPLDKVRHALLKRCKNNYQQGPSVALGNDIGKNGGGSKTNMDPYASESGAMGPGKTTPRVIDPGLLIVVKMLLREDPNKPVKGASAGHSRGVVGAGGNMQQQWFYTSQELVTRIFGQCLTAASLSTEGLGTAVTANHTKDGETPADPCLIVPHKGAKIKVRFDFKLPGDSEGPLGNISTDSIEIHYIRIEEVGNVQRLKSHYQRAVKGKNRVLPGNMGWWFDRIDEGKTPGKKCSIDVVISPGVPKPDMYEARGSRKKKGVPIVVQILTIETANPAEAM